MSTPPLPFGLIPMGTLRGTKGDRGDRGPTGTFADAFAVPVASDETNLKPVITGPEDARTITFKQPRGLPAAGSVENQEAIAAYIAARDSVVHQAVVTEIGRGFRPFPTYAAFAAARTAGTVQHMDYVDIDEWGV